MWSDSGFRYYPRPSLFWFQNMLERQRPDPLPEIHPLPEYLASGQRAAWYTEMKEALQVPWMGVVTMAFAHYPTFFAELWRGLEPLSKTQAFVDASQALRSEAEHGVLALQPHILKDELSVLGYAPRENTSLKDVNTLFSHGNPLYLLIATIARYLLEVDDLAGEADAISFTGRHAPDVKASLVLMEAHHADRPTQEVYEDIKATLGLPFVNTDYRAFARWPSYFALAWRDLREKVSSPAHKDLCQTIHELALSSVRNFPNPGSLNAKALQKAAAKDASPDEVIQVCRLFQWLLPGLMVNVAYFRRQLQVAD